MVSKTSDTTQDHCRYVIGPNHSLTWAQAKLIFAGLAAASLTAAVGFTLAGLWPILPFAGLELLGVGTCMYLCAGRGLHREVVTICGDTVQVEKGRRRPERRWSFPRAWAGVVMERPNIGWYPDRLFIRSHGRGVELGEFLNQEEKRQLARELSRSLERPLG